MKRQTFATILSRSMATAALLALCLTTTAASASPFSWGDYAGDNFMFLNVREDNGESTSLFAPEPGTGGPTVVADTLILDPQQFASESGGTTGNVTDLVDSTLTTTIMAGAGAAIDEITVSEFGDYSLGGLSGGEAFAEVGAAFFWKVLEVDNTPVSLLTQATNLILASGAGPNGGRYDRPGDDGTAVIWSGIASIDVRGYLDTLNISGKATKVSLRFDNTLQTGADAISNAYIEKKGVDISVVPEPTSLLLLGLGLAIMPCCRRRS